MMEDRPPQCAQRIPHEVLSDWLSNMLDPNEQVLIGRHVAECAACQRVVRRYQISRAALRDLRFDNVGVEIWRRLRPQIARRQLGYLPLVGRATLSILTLAVLAAFVVVFVLHRGGVSMPPASSTTASCSGSLAGLGVFVVRSDGSVQAFDGASGAQRWRSASGVGASGAAPVVADGSVFVLNNGTLVALHAQDGTQAWQASTTANASAPGLVAQEITASSVAIISQQNGQPAIMAVDPHTGTAHWQRPITSSATFIVGSVFALAATAQVVVAIASGHAGTQAAYMLFAFDATSGATLWQSPAQTTAKSITAADLLLTAQSVLVLADHLTAFDRGTGHVLWQSNAAVFDSSIAGQLATTGNVVLVQTSTQSTQAMVALRLADGTKAWSVADLAAGVFTDGQEVYLGGVQGNSITAVDVQTGGQHWHSQDFGLMDPVALGCKVVIGSFVNTIKAFDTATGTRLWTLALPNSTFYSSVAVASVAGVAILALPALDATSSIGAYNQQTDKPIWQATGASLEDSSLAFTVGPFT
jgi:outer membrane protein assembly factor BamB